ncbi:hypothetical protein [Calderihabitans maritimus]|uniref:Uncharacterized protein n=1 Tax=Calderihabitans maritimus TaxID=1246530 RepID=A0A1Z5HSX1_9FIRM|nr:hypothetical protein [Calderihabitans maritimus]GAW92421.1 hypothetical protein Dtox_0583 [Calderihabitans maritimus]
MKLVLLVLGFSLIALYEVPPLVKKKSWKELIAFALLMLMGVTMAVFQVLEIPFPNPNKAIEFVFKPVSQLVERMLTS